MKYQPHVIWRPPRGLNINAMAPGEGLILPTGKNTRLSVYIKQDSPAAAAAAATATAPSCPKAMSALPGTAKEIRVAPFPDGNAPVTSVLIESVAVPVGVSMKSYSLRN